MSRTKSPTSGLRSATSSVSRQGETADARPAQPMIRDPWGSAAATGAGEPGRDDTDHEAICRRCGVSCHLAIPVNGTAVTIPGLRCQFLEPDGGQWQCTVYVERFERAPWCHHADVAGPQGFLAHDCPYAVRSGYRNGKVTVTARSYARIWPALLGEMERCGVPKWVHREALLAEVARREGGVWRLRPVADELFLERDGAVQ